MKGQGQGEIPSYWTGIGGLGTTAQGEYPYATSTLVQGGVDCNTSYYSTSWYYAHGYSIVPNPYSIFLQYVDHVNQNNAFANHYLSYPNVTAGDNIYIQINYDSSTNYANLFFDNETNYQYLTIAIPVIDLYPISTEWEYERVAGNTDIIADVTMTDCNAQPANGGFQTFDSFNWTRCRSDWYQWPWFPNYEPTNIYQQSFTIHHHY
jgi:hypothetical protein